MGKKYKISNKEKKKRKWAMQNTVSYWEKVTGEKFEGEPFNEEDVETFAAMCKDIAIQRSEKRRKKQKAFQQQHPTAVVEEKTYESVYSEN